MNPNDATAAHAEVERALSTGDHELIAQSLLFHVWPLFNTNWDLMLAAVNSLPRDVIEKHPLLFLNHPMLLTLSRTADWSLPEIRPEVAQALSPGQLDLMILGQMIVLRIKGDESKALNHARQFADRIIETRADSRDRTDGPLWFYHLQIGSTFLSAGDTSQALLKFSSATQLARMSAQPDAERLTLGRTALAHAVRGSLGNADSALAAASIQPPASPAHAKAHFATMAAASALISADRMTDDLDDKIAALEPYDSSEFTWPFALLARVRSLLAQNRPHETFEALQLASQQHPHHGSFASDVMTSATVEALTATEEFANARKVLNQSVDRGGALTQLAAVRLALYTDDFDSAALGIRALITDPDLGLGQRVECALLAAWLRCARAGDVDEYAAVKVARWGINPDNRRIFASVPSKFVECVTELVPALTAESLTTNLSNLHHVHLRSRPQLTDSEQRVLRAITIHGTTTATARALQVSPNTIKSQLRSLYRKLECSTRQEAIQIATDFQPSLMNTKVRA
ncbi:helix-turn-helix transcriptional regulator [Microbacterium sp. A84]|uniref:helix-turn-helix transcriptional regulator n=1 Tax=Microbacterium sp. A84 TaxID=3450715 RepID=UPI003F43490F